MNRREDDALSRAEKWAIYFKKYGPVGLGIAAAPFLWPVAIEWVASQVIDSKMRPIIQRLDRNYDEILYSRAYASVSSMKTLISADDWDIMIRHRVRSQSIDEVKAVKSIWEYLPKNTDSEKKRMWNEIKNIFYKNRKIYVNELKHYGHPIVGNIGLYINRTFPMYKDSQTGYLKRKYRPDYSFLKNVYKITIETNYKDSEDMSKALNSYIETVRDEYFTDHYRILKKLESKISLNEKLKQN